MAKKTEEEIAQAHLELAKKSPMTLAELKEKDFVMHQFYKGMDDPADDWEGMSTPYDGLLIKFKNPETETTCCHCFLIVMKSVVSYHDRKTYCPQCKEDLGL